MKKRYPLKVIQIMHKNRYPYSEDMSLGGREGHNFPLAGCFLSQIRRDTIPTVSNTRNFIMMESRIKEGFNLHEKEAISLKGRQNVCAVEGRLQQDYLLETTRTFGLFNHPQPMLETLYS